MEYLNFFTDMHFEHPTVAFIRIMPEQALQWAGAGVYQPQEIGKTWQDMGMSKQKDTPTHTHGHTQTHTQTHAHTHTYAHPHTHLEVQPHIVKSTVGPPAISSVRRGKTVQSRPAECVCLMPVSL